MSTCFRRFFVWIVSIITITKAMEVDRWYVSNLNKTQFVTSELTELKVMMTNMNTKISLIEAKVSGLQVLEYAFKINTVDNSLHNMDTKINRITAQMDAMKNSCAGTGQELSNTRGGRAFSEASNELIEKIDDYGKKTKSSQEELMRMAEQETKELDAIKNISRTGFSKLYQKIENVLIMEGQLTTLSQDVRKWSPKFIQISDQMTDLNKDLDGIRTKVEWNSVKLQNITKEITTALEQMNNKTSNSTKRVLQITDGMKGDISELEDNIGNVKKALEAARLLDSDLRGKISEKNAAALKNLIEDLEVAEMSQEPLMSKLAERNREVNILLRGSVARTFDEFSALIDAIGSKKNCSGTFVPGQPSSGSSIGHSSGALHDIPQRLFSIRQGTNQQDIFDKLSYVRNSLLSIQDDARKYCNNNPPNQLDQNLGLFLG